MLFCTSTRLLCQTQFFLSVSPGGGCKLCGSVEHLKANCPQKGRAASEGLSSLSLQLVYQEVYFNPSLK